MSSVFEVLAAAHKMHNFDRVPFANWRRRMFSPLDDRAIDLDGDKLVPEANALEKIDHRAPHKLLWFSINNNVHASV